MSALRIDASLQRDGFRLDAELTIPACGVTAIVGPSGSGKSSLLRVIAGLEQPQVGLISFGDSAWVDTRQKLFRSPQQRRVGVVFQDYALFEHMTVAQNIAYGVDKGEAAATAAHWIERMQLDGLDDRYPRQLSGGQRQRVALARALAPKPDLLLLDEPFSAVDAHLRQNMRCQIKQLIADLQQPVLMITHDLEDVRQMADHVGVMIDGRIRRFAPVAEAFDQPLSYEVARVLGWRNFLYIKQIGNKTVGGQWGEMQLEQDIPMDSFALAIRPEHIRLVSTTDEGLVATVERITELGPVRELQCQLEDGARLLLLRPWNEPLPAAGSAVCLQLPGQNVRVLPERYHAAITSATGHETQQKPVTETKNSLETTRYNA